MATSGRHPIRWAIGALALVGVFAAAVLQDGDPEVESVRTPSQREWWLFPAEVNAARRLPHIEARLNDLHVVQETGEVWIAGDGGFVAVSVDRGTTWEQIDPAKGRKATKIPAESGQDAAKPAAAAWLGPQAAYAEAFPDVAPKLKGAVRAPVAAVAKEKLAEKPSPQPRAKPDQPALPKTPDPKSPLADVVSPRDFPVAPPKPQNDPPAQAWAPCDANGGMRTLSFRRVRFENATTGWLVADDGTLLKTADAGASWKCTKLPHRLTAIAFGRDAAWLTTDTGKVLKMNAAGRVAEWPVSRSPLRDIVLSGDGRTVWAIGYAPAVFVGSTDGDWAVASIEFNNDPEWNGILALRSNDDGSRAWAIGEKGSVIRVERTAVGWRSIFDGRLAIEDFGPDRSAAFRGNDLWIVGGNRIARYAADNLAAAPVVHAFDGSAQLRGVGFARESGEVWGFGESGVVVRVNADGTQRLLVGGWRSDLTAVAFAGDGRTGLAVGQAGELVSTGDGGQTWRQMAKPASGSIRTLRFFGADTQVAAGGYGVVEGSSLAVGTLQDGKWTWASVATNGGLGFVDDVAVLSGAGTSADPLRIVAVADGSKIWRTEQQGWKPVWVAGDESIRLKAVSFAADAQHGIAVGEKRKPTTETYAMPEGFVLRSDDGGATWRPARAPVATGLDRVTMTSAVDGWAVGSGSSAWRTRDGGDTWTAVSVQAGTSWLTDLAFTRDGERGWIVGSGGLIATTSNRGDTWQSVNAGDGRTLLAVEANPDGKRAWIAGEDGLLLRTANGGKEWIPVRYGRVAPAPWSIVAALVIVAIGVFTAVLARVLAPDSRQTSIAPIAFSDRPLEPGQPDHLDTRSLARGLARFLGNDATQPRLTVGVMGGWGTGKSSIMNEARAELQRYGFASAWFNAWHHQTEENLLAALFDTIRKEALPPLLSRDLEGLFFRWRLLKARAKQNPLPWLLFVSSLIFVVGHVAFAEEPLRYVYNILGRAVTWWKPFFGEKPDASAGLGASGIVGLGTLLGGTMGAVRFAWGGLSTFGVSPNLLVSRLTGQMHLGDLKANPGLRQQFQAIFRDVIQALGPRRPFVLFVDDLDRCLPERTLGVLEVVNFLMAAADCYVVIGMDRERVEGCVGMAFKDVANFLDENNGKKDPTNTDATTVQGERKNARLYARKYLDKLINIEVGVPSLRIDSARVLVTPPSDEGHRTAERRRRFLGYAGQAVLAAVLVGWAGFVGYEGTQLAPLDWTEPTKQDDPKGGTTESFAGATKSATVPPPSSAPPTGTAFAASPALPDVPNATYGTYLEGEAHDSSSWLWIFAGALLVLLFVAIRYGSAPLPPEKDSDEFTTALGQWIVLVHQATPTPRSVKRFVNRVRYSAMRQEGAEPRYTPFERLLGLRAPAKTNAGAGPEPIPASILVALSAIHHAHPEWVHVKEFWVDLRAFVSDPKRGVPAEVIACAPADVSEYKDRFLMLMEGATVR